VQTVSKIPAVPALHDSDFYTWAMETAGALRERRFETIDWEAVAEELEDMGRSERRELESRLEVLLAHLLKWRFQPQRRSSSWRGTIKEQRRKTARLLRQNPGLKPLMEEILADAYYRSLAVAERDTGIDEDAFPETCPWDIDRIMDEGFWPE
jgi:ribosomal protein L29